MSQVPVIPKYNLLSSGYSSFKDTWQSGKNYKILTNILPIVEQIGAKAVTLTSTYTGAESLGEFDTILRPTLVSADVACSPFVNKGIQEADKQRTALKPLGDLLRTVFPVQFATSVVGFVYETFLKNLEKIGLALKLEGPETSAN
jgi:hypothetical protein